MTPSDKENVFKDVSSENIRQRSLRGGTITLSNQALKFLLQTGSTVVMARLLTPEDFGLVAMVYSLLGFVTLLKDFGLSVATVQKASVSRSDLNGLFWINVLSGVCIMAILFILSPLVARFYEEPKTLAITMAFGGMAVLSSLGVQHAAILQRQMRFGSLAVRDLLSLIVGIAAGIIAALNGMAYWALIVKEIATTITSTIFLWFKSGWRPGMPRKSKGLKQLVQFGGSLTLANFLAYANLNLANVIIGKVLGITAVGFFSKSQDLLNKPLRQVLPPIMNVATPMFSRLAATPVRFKRATLQMVQLVCSGGCLLPMWVLPSADWIVLLVLGEQWRATIPLFQILAVFGLLEPLAYLLGTVLVAFGKPGDMARWWTVTITISLFSFIAGLPWGIVGVAAAYAISGVITRTWLIFFVGKRIGIPGFELIEACAPFVVSAAVVAGGLFAFRLVWEPANPLIGLVSFSMTGTVGYLAMLSLTGRGRGFLKYAYTTGVDTLQSFKHKS